MNAVENDIYLTVINEYNVYGGYHGRVKQAMAGTTPSTPAWWVSIAATCNRDSVRLYGSEPATMREICNAACELADYYAEHVRELESSRA